MALKFHPSNPLVICIGVFRNIWNMLWNTEARWHGYRFSILANHFAVLIKCVSFRSLGQSKILSKMNRIKRNRKIWFLKCKFPSSFFFIYVSFLIFLCVDHLNEPSSLFNGQEKITQNEKSCEHFKLKYFVITVDIPVLQRVPKVDQKFPLGETKVTFVHGK